MEPIAIVGLSYKLPQGAEDDSSFWDMLEKGRNTVSKWPESRANLDAFYHPNGPELNILKSKGAHFLKQDPAVFDAPFFSITSKEAASMDPQQRWMLETSYHALENAGIPIESIAGSDTSVYASAMAFDYMRLITKDADHAPFNMATGTAPSILANRLSWFYDLKGPSMALNTACSTSVIAADIAVQSLRSGQSSMSILAGTNAVLSTELSMFLTNMGFLSKDSVCHSFDERANGYGRGEGCIVVVLKRLSDAIKDGNMIRAVIRGTGSNQDGHTPGLTQPSGESQEDLIRRVYASAKLGYETTRYVEAHGTGTQVGDSTEVKSIGRVFRSSRSKQEPLWVGSIKANIGHLEAGSGLAGIAKCVSILERGMIPPVAMFEKLNPKINAKFYNIAIPTTVVPWPSSGLRRVSLNSFGFGGSNGHIILDDAYHTLEILSLKGFHNTMALAAPVTNGHATTNGHGLTNSHALTNGHSLTNGHAATNGHADTNGHTGTNGNTVTNGNTGTNGHVETNGDAKTNGDTKKPDEYQLLVWSAKDEAALKRMLPKQVQYFGSRIAGSEELLKRLSFTLAERRSVMPWRSFAVVSANDTSDSVKTSLSTPMRSGRDTRLGFIFTGQGAQYAGMGLGLLSYPVFASTLAKISKVFRDIGADWDLLEEMRNKERINNARFSQPLCTALQIALIELLKTFNILPEAVVGHSSGEIAAAYTIGALSLESACKVAYHRGRLAAEMSASQEVRGAMMSVNVPEGEVPAYLAKHSLESLTVACINSPTNVTISGPEDDIEALKQILDGEKIFARTVKTGIAYHSPAMKQIAYNYLESLGTLEAGPTEYNKIVMISSVTGEKAPPNSLTNPRYWVDNLVSPVRFADAIQYLAVAAPKVDGIGKLTDYLELGPAAALKRPAMDSLTPVVGEKGFRYSSVLSKFESPVKAVLGMVGRFFALGHSQVSVPAANSQTTPQQLLVDLPEYPFDHSQKYWHETRLYRDWASRVAVPKNVLGVRVTDWNPLEPRWRQHLSVQETPWLADHVIGDTILFPAAGTLMMALEAVRQSTDQEVTGFLVKEASFMKPVVLRSEGHTELITQLQPLQRSFEKNSNRFEVRIFAVLDKMWSEVFQSVIHAEYAAESTEVDNGQETVKYKQALTRDYEHAKEKCTKSIPKRDFYKWLDDQGLKYGPAFALSDNLAWDGGEIGTSCIDVTNQKFAGVCHPGVFDAAIQVCFLGPSKGVSAEIPTNVPRQILDAWVSASGWQHPETEHVRVVTKYDSSKAATNGLECTLAIYAQDGSPMCHVKRFTTSPVGGAETNADEGKKLLHSIDWKPQLALMNSDQLRSYVGSDDFVENETDAIDYAGRLEKALRAVLQRNINELVGTDWSHAPPQMKNYVAWVYAQLQQIPGRIVADVSEEELHAELDNLRNKKPSWSLMIEIAENFASIVHGEVDVQDYLGDTSLVREFQDDILSKTFNNKIVSYLELAAHQDPTQKILELGGGNGSFTCRVMDAFKQVETRTGGDAFSEYVFTDTSGDSFTKVQEQFAEEKDRMSLKPLDLEQDVLEQGFESEGYDIIFADRVLHKTKNLANTLQNVHRLLKPGGHLIFHEMTASENFLIQFAFGLTEAWWCGEEKTRISRPTVTEAGWHFLLQQNGFSGNDLVVRDFKDDTAHQASIIASTASPALAMPSNDSRTVYFVVNSGDEYQTSVASVAALGPFTKLGYQTKVLTIFDLVHAPVSPTSTVVFLADMGKSLLADVDATTLSWVLKWIRHATNLLWVTAVDTSENPHPPSKPFSDLKDGFLRTLRSEFTSKHIVALSYEGNQADMGSLADTISKVFLSAFEAVKPELEYIARQGQVLIGRMVEEPEFNRDLNSTLSPQRKSEPWLPGPPLKLDIATRGSLETFQFIEDMDYYEPLGPHDVEIEAKAWGVSFQDLFAALGRLDDGYLGSDCAGVVTRVGSECKSVSVGDRVCMYTMGCMKAYPRCEESTVVQLPENISFDEGCAIASPALTAWYSLVNVARLQKGEKVLIHAGSGATGQLSIQVANLVGAEVFATVGYEHKKKLLQDSYGIPADHIFYSRDLSFAKGILRLTDNYGVDVVLNSLVGEGLRASWEILAPYGRFLEIGKADINANSQLPMASFAGNRSFSAIDLRHVFSHRREISKALLRKTMDLAGDGIIHAPNPIKTFELNAVEDAFRYFQSGNNTGRIVINVNPSTVVQKRVIHRRTWTFDPNGTILVSGGLGGIGRSMLRWMASKGAKNLIVPSRSGAASGAAAELVEELTQEGVTIVTPKCDVSNKEALQQMLDECGKTMPPVKGCINAAMVLNDSIFENMTHDQWERTVRSKVETSWNLHALLPENLDFFILLSSVSGIIGNGGQANYAAGCTFQDSLARFRINNGRKALSIDVGAMKGVGVIAETEKLSKTFSSASNLVQVEEKELLGLLDIACDPELPFPSPTKSQVSMGIVTPKDLLSRGMEPVEMMQRPMFAHFSQARGLSGGSGSANVVKFGALFRQSNSVEEKAELVSEALAQKLARALSMQPEDIDGDKPLHAYGVDSLVAVELRNWIGKEFMVDVSVFEIMGGKAISAIAKLIAEAAQTKSKK